MKPIMVYDGDCSFCRDQVLRYWKKVTGDSIDYAPYQEVAQRFPQVSLKQFEGSVHLILPDGQVYSGAHAIFRAYSYAPGKGGLLWMYQHIPGFAPLTEWAYRETARHRLSFFSRGTR